MKKKSNRHTVTLEDAVDASKKASARIATWSRWKRGVISKGEKPKNYTMKLARNALYYLETKGFTGLDHFTVLQVKHPSVRYFIGFTLSLADGSTGDYEFGPFSQERLDEHDTGGVTLFMYLRTELDRMLEEVE